jgi:hypothetical protein
MSELTQAPLADSLDDLDDPGGKGRNSRLLALLAVVAGLVVLGLAAFFLFFSGGGEEDLGGTVPTAQPPAAVEPKQGGDKANTKKKDKTPPVFNGSVGRDPFQPLAIEEVIVPPEAAVQPAGGTGTSDGTSSNTAPVAAPDYYLVVYRGTSGGTVTMVVNGVTYPVQVGDLFPDRAAGPFKVERVIDGGKKVVIKFGSETYELTQKKVLSIKI